MSKIWLISGASGVGKTALLQRILTAVRTLDDEAAGWLTPPLFRDGQKIGILAQDVRSGETRPLARRGALDTSILPEAWRRTRFNLPLGQWLFAEETLDWGNGLFANAAADSVLFVDELGPLEWILQAGLQQALRALDAGRGRLALVVVRPSLLSAAQQRWPSSRVLFL